MGQFAAVVSKIDDMVWGPVMQMLFVGTGIFLTFRLGFATWRNLGNALKWTLGSSSRRTGGGEGDISPFAALTTALAATIGTGNIVGVATAMVSGGPGALVWMWISAAFGLSAKFSECMLAVKYREVNARHEMSGGPMYTMKKAFKNKAFGAGLGWIFAFFAVLASFGIGNMTQANSIAEALHSAFLAPANVTGIILTILTFTIIVGGIRVIAKVSAVVVPVMAAFYVICGLIIIIVNARALPEGIAMIFQMAFSIKAVGGGLCGTITSAMMGSIRYGVARGVFSNEAGMGSAAISAAAAATDHPVRQGYINMTGTFWDTIVVCTVTGLCLASSGVLGSTALHMTGSYTVDRDYVTITAVDTEGNRTFGAYRCTFGPDWVMLQNGKNSRMLYAMENGVRMEGTHQKESLAGTFTDAAGNHYVFQSDGHFRKEKLVSGAALTILAFQRVFGDAGGWMIAVSITLFAFSTILGWEYHGEKAFEYLLKTHRYHMVYRMLFAFAVYMGATTALDLVWNLSDIANALMAVPNLICLLALSGEIAGDVREFQEILHKNRNP